MQKLGKSPEVRIDVTSAIIDLGIKRDSSHCIIAAAVKEAVPHATHVSVDIQTIRFSDKKKWERYTYLTPRTVQVSIIDFDQGLVPTPFNFRLQRGQVTTMRNGGWAVKPKLVQEGSEPNKSVPHREGGLTPPLANRGKVRTFGIKGYK